MLWQRMELWVPSQVGMPPRSRSAAPLFCQAVSGDCQPTCTVGIPSRRSEEHTSELQSQSNLVCRLLLEKQTAQYLPPPVNIMLQRNFPHGLTPTLSAGLTTALRIPPGDVGLFGGRTHDAMPAVLPCESHMAGRQRIDIVVSGNRIDGNRNGRPARHVKGHRNVPIVRGDGIAHRMQSVRHVYPELHTIFFYFSPAPGDPHFSPRRPSPD